MSSQSKAFVIDGENEATSFENCLMTVGPYQTNAATTMEANPLRSLISEMAALQVTAPM